MFSSIWRILTAQWTSINAPPTSNKCKYFTLSSVFVNQANDISGIIHSSPKQLRDLLERTFSFIPPSHWQHSGKGPCALPACGGSLRCQTEELPTALGSGGRHLNRGLRGAGGRGRFWEICPQRRKSARQRRGARHQLGFRRWDAPQGLGQEQVGQQGGWWPGCKTIATWGSWTGPTCLLCHFPWSLDHNYGEFTICPMLGPKLSSRSNSCSFGLIKVGLFQKWWPHIYYMFKTTKWNTISSAAPCP